MWVLPKNMLGTLRQGLCIQRPRIWVHGHQPSNPVWLTVNHPAFSGRKADALTARGGCSGLDPNRGPYDDFMLQHVLWIGGPQGRAKPPSPRILRAATGCAYTASTLGRSPQNGARYDDEVAPSPNPRLERNRLAMASQ